MKIDEQKRDNNYYLRQTAGISAGATVALTPKVYKIKKLLTPLSETAIEKKKIKVSQIFPVFDTFENIKKYADDIIDKTGLRQKNVRISVWTTETLKKLKPLAPPTTLYERIKYIESDNRRKIWANGLNASFIPNKKGVINRNFIIINNERLYFAVFHEIGHALNANSDKLSTKMLVKAKKLSKKNFLAVSLTCLGIGLFHNKKSPAKKKSKFQKTMDFVHNNAGKIIFLAFSPVILEEGLASIKGKKLAKSYLNTAQNKLHAKNLSLALFSYISMAVISSCAVTLGILVKDKIIQGDKRN